MVNLSPMFRCLALGSVLGWMSSGCITIAPNSTPSLSWKPLSKPKIAHASFEQNVDEIPNTLKNPARLKLAYGQLMEEKGQHAEARKSYSAVVEAQPKNVEAILGLARLDQLSGSLEQAEQGFRRAVKLDPSSAAAHYGLGQFYASQKRWKEANPSLTKAMLAEPDQAQYRYALAVALVHTGDVDSALPHFIRTIGDAEAHYNVGLILQEEGHLGDAERQFALAVAKKPELTAAQNWLAHLRRQQSSGEVPSSETVPGGDAGSTVIPVGHSSQPEKMQAPRPAGTQPFGMPLSAQQQEQAANQFHSGV